MARIIGIDIPEKKRLVISLTYLYGIGPHKAVEICDKLKLNPSTRVKDLSSDDIAKINTILQSDYTVEGDLRRQVRDNIQRLIKINSYRGMRHRTGLPVRGQRTKTNSRTRKGRKKTVANKKK